MAPALSAACAPPGALSTCRAASAPPSLLLLSCGLRSRGLCRQKQAWGRWLTRGCSCVPQGTLWPWRSLQPGRGVRWGQCRKADHPSGLPAAGVSHDGDVQYCNLIPRKPGELVTWPVPSVPGWPQPQEAAACPHSARSPCRGPCELLSAPAAEGGRPLLPQPPRQLAGHPAARHLPAGHQRAAYEPAHRHVQVPTRRLWVAAEPRSSPGRGVTPNTGELGGPGGGRW